MNKKNRISRRKLLKKTVQIGAGLSASYVFPAFKAKAEETSHSPFMLLVYCEGGWDQTIVFDSKNSVSGAKKDPGYTTETIDNITYSYNSTCSSVKDFFTDHHEKCVIINGINVGAMDHKNAARRMLTHNPKDFKNIPSDYLSYYAIKKAPSYKFPHIVINAPYSPGIFSQTTSYIDNKMITELTSTSPSDHSVPVEAYLVSAYDSNMTKPAYFSLDYIKHYSYQTGYVRGVELSKAIEDHTLLDDTFAEQGKFAVDRFIAGESHCATIRCKGKNAWDTHDDDITTQSENFRDLFTDLKTILDHWNTENTNGKEICIVVMSELGRRPHDDSIDGKGHWSTTSMLVYGPGLTSGVFGTTDDYGRAQDMNPYTPSYTTGKVPITIDHVYGALFKRYGLPYLEFLPDMEEPLLAMLD